MFRRRVSQGARRIRTGFDWGAVEQTKGVYTWDFYDSFMDELERLGVAALFCVHPKSRLYPGPRIPVDQDAVDAFARFVQALTARYGARPGFWYAEITNEPNLADNATARLPQTWSTLAVAVTKAVRGNASSAKARLAGPALANAESSTAWPITRWLEAALNGTSLSNDLDLITIHTYRATAPETVARTFSATEDVVRAAAPAPESAAPVASGEWGYSSCTFGGCHSPVTDEAKALYLAREWLTGHVLGRPLAAWYDWREDCTDPGNRECRFGVVTHDDFSPLPAYRAGRAALAALDGMWATDLVVSDIEAAAGGQGDDDDDYGEHLSTWVVSYAGSASLERAEEMGLAATPVDAAAVWIDANGNSTSAGVTANVTVQLDAGRSYAVTDAFGKALPAVTGPFAVIEASGAPVYLRA